MHFSIDRDMSALYTSSWLSKVHAIDQSDMVDRFGNTIERPKAKAALSSKEKKLKMQRRQKRFKETGDDYDSAEDEVE